MASVAVPPSPWYATRISTGRKRLPGPQVKSRTASIISTAPGCMRAAWGASSLNTWASAASTSDAYSVRVPWIGKATSLFNQKARAAQFAQRP
jgi:hypothetical protein